MFKPVDTTNQDAVIKVIGVGGGGGNAVEHMLTANIEGVDFICANTDAQVLNKLRVKTLIQLGANITRGLGAGSDPEVGKQAALEDRDRIMDVLQRTDMVFITAGMGGGTGTGAAPIVAQAAREMGILTVAVVTRPFSFEGVKRAQLADQGVKALCEHVDSLITIPNDKLPEVLGRDIPLCKSFAVANDVLLNAVQGIAELITKPGMINLDFADVRTVMSEMGMAMMGSGKASGEDCAKAAAQAAISSPLLEDVDLSGARGVLVNVTAGIDLTTGEFEDVGDRVKSLARDDAIVLVGVVIDPELSGEMRVTIVATGLGKSEPEEGDSPSLELVIASGEPDYGELDKPTVIRNNSAQQERAARDGTDPDALDVPSFLRKQAD